jgi:hypothetical protein
MRCAYLLKSGEIVEGSVVEENESVIKIDGFRYHVDNNKSDLLEIKDSYLTDKGEVSNQQLVTIAKEDIISKVLKPFSKNTQGIKPVYVPDDEAWMGKGYYNSLTGNRLLQVRQDIKPFGGCVVEILSAEIIDNMPVASVRIYKDSYYLEGMQYKVDEELEEFTNHEKDSTEIV